MMIGMPGVTLNIQQNMNVECKKSEGKRGLTHMKNPGAGGNNFCLASAIFATNGWWYG